MLRYSYMDSDDVNGLQLARYEDRVVEGLGDRYEEVFAGVNLFLYGHKFKLADRAAVRRYGRRGPGRRTPISGLGVSTVLRIYW